MAITQSNPVGPIGFRIWRVRTPPTMKGAHTHPDIEINCVESGFIEYLFAGIRVRVEAGNLAVFWGGVPHQLDRCGRTSQGIWLTVPVTDFLRWPLPGGLPEKLLGGGFAQMPVNANIASQWLVDFNHEEGVRHHIIMLELEAALNRLALAWKAPLPRATPAGNETERGNASHVARVAAFLAVHYTEELSLPRIAAAVRLHPKYLARLFKAKTRLTLHEYLTRLRVSHAQRLLATSDARVIDIAMECGFGSMAGFYAAFAWMAGGISPHRYRRKRSQPPATRIVRPN